MSDKAAFDVPDFVKGPVDLLIGSVWVNVKPADRWLQTVYPDGAKLVAAVVESRAAVKTAQELGYGKTVGGTYILSTADLWKMTVEHEVLHTVLCRMLGGADSPTLYYEATEGRAGLQSREAREAEETTVLEVQKYLNTGEQTEAAKLLAQVYPSVAAKRKPLKTIIREHVTNAIYAARAYQSLGNHANHIR